MGNYCVSKNADVNDLVTAADSAERLRNLSKY